MQHIRILALGKIKENYLAAGLAEYQKRLKPFCKLQICEFSDEKTPLNASAAEANLIKEREGKRILEALKDKEYIIALDIGGQNFSSEQLAAHMADLPLKGYPNLAFVIGGSLGLSQEVLAKADLRLSFGRLTLPHQLMRLVLIEQIYRSFKINRNESYHK